MNKPRPVNHDKAAAALVLLINQHIDKPCPTREHIMTVTGLQRRAVWPFIEDMQSRGVIEIEQRGTPPNVWRRMRVFGREWTDWTERKAAACDAGA